MLGAGLLLSPAATLPFYGDVPWQPEGQASWLAYGWVWIPVFSALGGGEQDSLVGITGHITVSLSSSTCSYPPSFKHADAKFTAISPGKHLQKNRLFLPSLYKPRHRLGKSA